MNGIQLLCLAGGIFFVLKPIVYMTLFSYFFICILKKNGVIKKLKITTLLVPILLPIVLFVGIVLLYYLRFKITGTY